MPYASGPTIFSASPGTGFGDRAARQVFFSNAQIHARLARLRLRNSVMCPTSRPRYSASMMAWALPPPHSLRPLPLSCLPDLDSRSTLQLRDRSSPARSGAVAELPSSVIATLDPGVISSLRVRHLRRALQSKEDREGCFHPDLQPPALALSLWVPRSHRLQGITLEPYPSRFTSKTPTVFDNPATHAHGATG